MKVETERPKAFTIKYKRPRGLRACVVCRLRKVRCDAEIHIPCTNCITFGCECTVPVAKKRGNSTVNDVTPKRKQSKPLMTNPSPLDDNSSPSNGSKHHHPMSRDSNGSDHQESTHTTDKIKAMNASEAVLNILQVLVTPSLHLNQKIGHIPTKEELLNPNMKTPFSFFGQLSIGGMATAAGQHHSELKSEYYDAKESPLDSVELEILKLRGTFLLPSKDLTADLVETFFERVHPLFPVINRTEFMRKFNDPNDLPSLMLLHAVLLCGARVSSNSLIMDSEGLANLAIITFFRRAKALFDANYESDPVTIIQSLILISLYWEGPEDVTKNSWHWVRAAISLAQGFGFHRDVLNSTSILENEKKIWRRIWWSLFEKDRNVAVAFGRPSMIDLTDCDVPMITIDDFDESEDGKPSPYPVRETEALYFIHLVKLAEITGIIVKHQYSVKAEIMKRRNKFPIIQHCDMLMGIWFTNLPPKLVFLLQDKSTQNFYLCLINAQYYNRLYLIHRLNLLKMAKSNLKNPNNYRYPSWGILFQSARMILLVLKTLLDKDEIKYCPTMFVYIVFSSLLMLIYHVDLANQVIALTASDSLFVSKAVLKKCSEHWPVAGFLVKLFEKTASNKLKRARIVENQTKQAEYSELEAQIREENGTGTNFEVISRDNVSNKLEDNEINHNGRGFLGIDNRNGGMLSPTAHLTALGILPGGVVRPKELEGKTTIIKNERDFDDLVLEMKTQNHNPNTSVISSAKVTNDTSPTSSTQLFPDFSLVTENMPKQNFFDNFQPTQLFPEVLTPALGQSPGLGVSQDLEEDATNDAMYDGDGNLGMGANFVDQSFLTMNLQLDVNNYASDDLAAFFLGGSG